MDILAQKFQILAQSFPRTDRSYNMNSSALITIRITLWLACVLVCAQQFALAANNQDEDSNGDNGNEWETNYGPDFTIGINK